MAILLQSIFISLYTNLVYQTKPMMTAEIASIASA